MSTLEVRMRDNRTEFRPLEAVEGSVMWQLDASVEALELRLIWWTSGKGDTDVSVEDVRRFDTPSLSGDSAFRFVLPEAPYSFSGRLVSLSWALELVVMPGEDATRYEFSMSPNGREIELPAGEGPAAVKEMPGWLKSRMQKGNTSSSALEQRSPFDTTSTK